LQEAEKSHREFLENLYINTLYALGVLGSAVGLIFAFFHYKSYKDIEKAVEAKFNKSVEAKVDNALDDFKKELERKKEDVEKDLERVKEDVRARLGDLSDVVQRQGGVEDTEAVAAPDLDQQELKILKLTGSGRYSFRSLAGIANDSGQSQADVAAQLERLSKKGVVGKTLGNSGAERWFVTTEGRKYLMAGSPTA
jgi:DNA-binding MarR family transcriptional regulator